MKSITRRPRFKADLRDAYGYIADRNPQAAQKVLYDLEEKFQLLAEFPFLGTARLRTRPEARVTPYRDYVLLYRVLDDDAGTALVRLYGPREDWEHSLIEDAAES